MNNKDILQGRHAPSALLSFAPIAALIVMLLSIIVFLGADKVSTLGPVALLAASLLAIVISLFCKSLRFRQLRLGIVRSARQMLPAIPVLACIALISTTWMLGGVVPTLICYGLDMLSPKLFLFLTCAVCSAVSVILGSSWTTIATVGVAFMGIGTVMGYYDGWIAGAIISGAYFGDKVSPLSDTTVLASSTCGVDLFTHIRYLMLTAAPAMGLALLIFLAAGFLTDTSSMNHTSTISAELHHLFVISPWLLLVPVATMTMCIFRLNSLITLVISALFGLVCIFVSQPAIMNIITSGGTSTLLGTLKMLLAETLMTTPSGDIDSLVTTGGLLGMMPTIILVLCAMTFGGTLIGTGMLSRITHTLTARLNRNHSVVGATVATGLTLNSCTSDQYLSIIIGGNLYRNLYRRLGLEPRLLSRTLEDSVSVTSVLIPWNSCGLTQSTVLGVGTLTYLPYCFFNYLSPMVTMAMAVTGYRIARALRPAVTN